MPFLTANALKVILIGMSQHSDGQPDNYGRLFICTISKLLNKLSIISMLYHMLFPTADALTANWNNTAPRQPGRQI